MKVCKFGGSSVKNSTQIKKIVDIVKRDEKRQVIVVSAPGRDDDFDEKITDHLLNLATEGNHFLEQKIEISKDDSFNAIIKKYTKLCDDLGIAKKKILDSLENELNNCDFKDDKKTAFFLSRGEHYNAKIISDYMKKSGLNVKLMLPEEFGFILDDTYTDGKVQAKTYDNVKKHFVLKDNEKVVVPGFYGVTEKNEIAVMSRGGSDLTGGELAYALDASMYENWTDTNGVYEVDPRVIPDAKVIPRLTFKELRLLSSKGFNVFHFNAMLNCKKSKIPIRVRNTNNPTNKGTLILSERVPMEKLVGVAKLDNMASIHIQKDMLGEEIGFTAELLKIFGEFHINTYHYPTDKDDLAILVEQEDLKGNINNLRREIDKRLKPDNIIVTYSLSVITLVGIGLKEDSFTIVDAITALKENNIAFEMFDMSPSKISFHIGVSQNISDIALETLYEKLLTKENNCIC
ncbi:aspartate kinase [Malaciobacter canalis]|uniref:Aspartokinase n=2 Tax=Malaciobacter TaxID=2321114 RepID=A0AB37A148_9BACT|nr:MULTISPECIES: aspartate kinase [Malaciobacter]PHO11005.1 aspartate kinase [Malaciobacter canalis]PPK62917.1 aspartate kinase [Malaciobacter marinus]QEE33083.1 aspartate kinase [Malaciobacter canalis]